MAEKKDFDEMVAEALESARISREKNNGEIAKEVRKQVAREENCDRHVFMPDQCGY